MTEVFNVTIPGLGVTIGYATTSGGSATAVTQVQSIDGTNWEVGAWDSTGLQSSSGEQNPTIFKGGDFGFKVIYDPSNTTHIALQSYMIAKTFLYWTLTFPSPIGPGATAPESPHTYKFAGFISGFTTEGFEVESDVTAAVKVAISGDITVA